MITPWHAAAPRKFLVAPPTLRPNVNVSQIRPRFAFKPVPFQGRWKSLNVIPEVARKTFKDSWREDTKAILFTTLMAVVLFAVLEGQRWKGAVNEKITQLFNDKILRNQELAAALTRVATEFTQQFASNEKIQQDVSERLKAFVKSQGPALRQALLDEVLRHPEFEDAAIQWAKDQAVAVCNDPVTVEAMADLITQATELPSTQEAVSGTLRDLINQPELTDCAVEFVSKAMNSPAMHTEVSKASRNAIEHIAQDPKVQATLSSTIWSVMRRSMLPKWMWAAEDQPPVKVKKSRRASADDLNKVLDEASLCEEVKSESDEPLSQPT